MQPTLLADPERDGALYCRDVTCSGTPAAVPSGVLRLATGEDIEPLEEAMHASGEYLPGVVAERLNDGRSPYIVLIDGLIASYGWVAFSAEPIGDLGFSFRLDPDDAYIYDCATRPAYRGRGLYPALLHIICADLAARGWRCAWIGTAPGNFISQRGIVRAGFRKIADVNFSHRPDGSFKVDLYGVPGVSQTLLDHAAWAFHGFAHVEAGLPS